MSEPTKEALELAKQCAAEITEAFNVAAYNMREWVNSNYEDPEPKEPDVTEIILRHTASLREELRAAREALDTVLTGNEEGGLQYWIRKHDALLLEVLAMPERAARNEPSACKGGDAV